MTHPPPDMKRAGALTPAPEDQSQPTGTKDITTREEVARLAKRADVSQSLMWMILYVLRHGIPDLSLLIEAGTLSGSRAYKIAKLPRAEQERIAADIAAGKQVKLAAPRVEQTRYDRLVRAWNACAPEERREFYGAIEEEEG